MGKMKLVLAELDVESTGFAVGNLLTAFFGTGAAPGAQAAIDPALDANRPPNLLAIESPIATARPPEELPAATVKPRRKMGRKPKAALPVS